MPYMYEAYNIICYDSKIFTRKIKKKSTKANYVSKGVPDFGKSMNTFCFKEYLDSLLEEMCVKVI